ncbi:MAG: type II toxin-antitoxin system RelE/ParE family toxin [Acidobacteria bacterium]|nr:MAG: type II toxin-antitoxin system RelE/ParE family toxin [Acidobacteriota bacterium]
MNVPALPVVFTRRAARQVETASEWWRANRLDAPGAIQAELAGALSLIATQPGSGAPITSRRFRGVRRLHLARIGYHVYYRLAPRLGRVEVVAFWHARRGSDPVL